MLICDKVALPLLVTVVLYLDLHAREVVVYLLIITGPIYRLDLVQLTDSDKDIYKTKAESKSTCQTFLEGPTFS